MATLNDFIYTDSVDDVMAAYVNRLLGASLRSEYKNVETLSADRELTDADTPIQAFECGAADRVVTMPTEGAVENHPFLLVNDSAAARTITIKNNAGSTTLNVLAQGEMCLMLPVGDGTYKALIGDAPADGTQYARKDHAWEGAAGGALSNSNIAPTTANVTAVVNTRYFADISGLTADRNFVVPAGAVGDMIEVCIKTGDDTHELVIIGDTGVTINGGSAATEWSRLFMSEESVQLVADTISNWQVVKDGRKPCIGKMTRTGSSANTTHSANTWTTIDWNTAPINRGNICDLTNDRFNVRRAGTYKIAVSWAPAVAIGDQVAALLNALQNATQIAAGSNRQSVATTARTVLVAIPGAPADLAVGDTVTIQFQTGSANIGVYRTDSGDDLQGQTFCAIEECLP